MSPDQIEEVKQVIKQTIQEEVEKCFENRFSLALQKIDSIAKNLDIGFANMDEDRKDFAIMKTNQATIQQLMKEVLDIVSNQANRIAKSVENKTDKAIESSAQAIADSVEPVMASIVNKMKKGILLNKKPFWKFWKNW